MNTEEIREFFKLVETSQIEELEVKRWGKAVVIRKHAAAQIIQSDAVAAAPAVAAAQPAAAPATSAPQADVLKANEFMLKSPMVGTFYRASSPEADVFVKEGDTVAPGQVICIIEAMKVMNEIVAEKPGKVAAILVENAKPVEFDQDLVRFEE